MLFSLSRISIITVYWSSSVPNSRFLGLYHICSMKDQSYEGLGRK